MEELCPEGTLFFRDLNCAVYFHSYNVQNVYSESKLEAACCTSEYLKCHVNHMDRI